MPLDFNQEGDVAQLVKHSLSVREVAVANPGGQGKLISPFSRGWLGHNINVECSARLETSLGLNPVTEGK